ncbi:MAG TPA: SH3 domain-containing protein [bacterium]|nr:SH3 domain-containing protein [bacterium]
MKSIVFWLCLAMASPAAADLFVVEANTAKVYSAPSTTSPVVGQAVRNEICAVAESDWIYVLLPDGRAGWLRLRDGRRLTTQQAAAEAFATETPAAEVTAAAAAATATAAAETTARPVLSPVPVDARLYAAAQRQIVRWLPNHAGARPLRVEDLARWASVQEQQLARTQQNRYVLYGDFNGNGRMELAIAGLLAEQPTADKEYRVFLLVVEQRADGGWVKVFSDQSGQLRRGMVENMFWFTDDSGALCVGYANQSGFMARLAWDGMKYRLDHSMAN